MRNLRKLGVLVGAATLLAGAACGDLDITNPNNPDIERALKTPDDVKNLAISSVNSWYFASTDFEPFMMMEVTSDALTANFGNFGMRFNNLEPRVNYDNLSTGADAGVSRQPWDQNYAALGAANDVLLALKKGLVITNATETDKYKELAMFTQAATLTNVALTFDKGFVVDESFDPSDKSATKPTLKPYNEVAAAALAKWDALIALSAGKAHSYDPSTLPLTVGPLTSARLNRIANTFAAALLAFTPRNATQAAAVDWAKVASYAAKGIGSSGGTPFDVSVIGDATNWWSYILYYGNDATWTRVDMRLINEMDPTQPTKFNGTVPPKATSADARLTSDFKYWGGTSSVVIGDPGRGIYMQSPYSHIRWEYHNQQSPTSAEGPAPYLLAAENDLLHAEALIRSGGSLATAATLINNSRVGRGNLPAATAADGATTLLGYIAYERDIELLNTNGWELFRRRHIDGLQPGTLRHLPIPARELETLSIPVYTFGGVGKPDM